MRSRRGVLSTAVSGVVALVVVGLAVVGGSARAWATTVSDLSVPGDNASAPSIAADGLGNAVAVFRSHDGTVSRVQAVYRPVGGTWSAPVTLSVPGQEAFQPEPRVAVDGTGRAIAVWEASVDGVSRLQTADRRADGTWSTPVTLSGADHHAGSPAIAVDPRGGATVVWHGSATSGDAPDDVRAIHRPAGGTWGSPLVLADHAVSPHVDVDGQGNAVAVWTQSVDGILEVRTATLPSGRVWSKAVTLSEPGRDAKLPRVAVNASGTAVAVWRGYDGSDWRVQAARRPSGGAWSAPALVSGSGRSAEDAEVALDGTGNAVAVWRRDGVVNVDSDAVQVADLPAGGSWSAPVTVSSADLPALEPKVSVDTRGNVVAAWRSGDGTNWRTVARRRPVGQLWGSELWLSDSGQNAFNQQITVDGQGNAIAAWYRYDGNKNVVQATGLDYAGPASTVTRPGVRRQTTTGFTVSWSATDAWGEVRDHDVRYRVAGYDGGFGSWVSWLTGTTSGGATFAGEPGLTYCFSVRSRDDWGRLGAWSTQRCTATPVDDRSLTARGVWDRASGSGLYEGTQSIGQRQGDVLILRGVRAKHLSLLVTRAPDAGKVRVSLAGETLGTYRLASSAVAKRSLISVKTFPAVSAGTLRIRVVSPSGKRVRIDGVVVLRA